jgi:hypothetical protein
MQTLNWDELEPAAREAFNIWMSGSDLEWAKTSWRLLVKDGLCNYETERERHVVIARYLALASVYRDWCSVAFDETNEDVPTYWIDGLDVEPIYVGQILADEELSDDPEEALSDGLHCLLNSERDAIIKALQKVYGGTVEDLFVSLWRSVKGFNEAESGDEDYVEEEDYAEILNQPTAEKLAGYAWVTEGCPNVRP